MNKFSHPRHERGFTLIELLTVIIIVGILAAIAIPVFSAQKSRGQDSQTISDVRNIVTAAESLLSDRTKSVSDLSQASLEYASSNNVLWNISGNTTTGGYCIAAFNASGKDYKTTSTLLTYDSTAGGLKKVGGSCGTVVGGVAGANGSVTPTPTSSTGVGSDTVRNAVAPTSAGATRAGANGAITWTASTDTNVTGYAIQRSDTSNGTFTTVGTVSGRTTATYTDTTAAASNTYYYRVASMVGAGTSTTTSNTATLNPAFSSVTYNYTGGIQSFTVPYTGNYTIYTYGGQGGGNSYQGGLGGYLVATHTLTAGDVYAIAVGGAGYRYGSGGAGGGGGTFVYKNSAAQPLQVSGGGGGTNDYHGGASYAGKNAIGDPSSSGNGTTLTGSYGGSSWGSSNAGSAYGGGNRDSNWIGYGGQGYGGGYAGGGGIGSDDSGGGGGGYTGGTGSHSGGNGGTSYLAAGAVVDTTSQLAPYGASNYGNGSVSIYASNR